MPDLYDTDILYLHAVHGQLWFSGGMTEH